MADRIDHAAEADPTPDTLPDDVLDLARQIAALDPTGYDIAESSAVVYSEHGPEIASRFLLHLDTLLDDTGSTA
ncbi:hypothetical protein [Salana multivorans]